MKVLHIVNMTFVGGGVNTVIPSQIKFENTLQNIKSELLVTAKDPKIPDNLNFDFYIFNEQNIYDILKKSNPDIAIFHSFYKLEYLKIYKKLNEFNIPFLIKPHGSFIKNAQKKSWLKKKVANVLFFNRFIKNSKGIIYLNYKEKEYSYLNNDLNTYILPNGITDVSSNEIKDFNKKNTIKFMFLGRIDFKDKGIDLFLESVFNSKSKLAKKNVQFSFFGFGKDTDKLKTLIKKYEINSLVKFKGSVFGENKEEAFKKHHIFILTSRNEGMPMGVIEALNMGLPCLLTPNTNLSDLVKNNKAGWEVNLSQNSISEGLFKSIYDYRADHKTYINNARNLAKSFWWENLTEIYRKEYYEIIKNEGLDV